jgi:transposase
VEDKINFLGIDVAKEKVDVVLLRGEQARRRTFGNTPTGHGKLWQWLTKHGGAACHACLEATGPYGEKLALFLHERAGKVSVVNPARVKGFRQSELGRTKTDEADAALIARFCRAMKPALWQPPASHIRELQAFVRRLENINSMRLKEVNRLHVINDNLRENVTSFIEFFDKKICDLKKKIKEHIKKHKDLEEKQKLLESIPGVAEATIAVILTFLAEPEKFRSAKQVAAFVGLNPKQRQSGSSVRGQTRLSKTGNSFLRKSLYMPALSAKRSNPLLAAFAKRLEKEGKRKMVILGAVMRKLLHLIYGVLKSGRPFNPELANARS